MINDFTLKQALLNHPNTYFSDDVINKSKKYLLGTRITDFKMFDDNFASCIINGTKKYLVSMTTFNGKISFKCNCDKTGFCKHQAALYLYTQNKLGIKMTDDEIDNKTYSDLCFELRYKLGKRLVVTMNNIDILKDHLNLHLNYLLKLFNEREYQRFSVLFINLSMSLLSIKENNLYNDDYIDLMNDYLLDNIDNVISSYKEFIKTYERITLKDKQELLISLIDPFLYKLSERYIDENIENKYKFLEFLLKELNNTTFLNNKEVIDNLTYYKTKINIILKKDVDYELIKSNIKLLKYKILCLKYIIENELYEDLYWLYSEPEVLNISDYEFISLFIKATKKAGLYELTELFIYNLVSKTGVTCEEISEIIDEHKIYFDEDFIKKVGGYLFLSEKYYEINKLSLIYKEFDIYSKSIKNFDTILNDYSDYINDYSLELLMILYTKIIETFKDSYYLSPRLLKKVFNYIDAMSEIESGEFYIYDLLGYLERKYMSTSVRELKKYIGNLDI